MIDPTALGKMVPGLNFLDSWMRGAGQATPGMGQWIAPTLDPAELEKRIGELKTVQFWLEQNTRMIGATVQAMEVQRMTLTTLQTMNLPLAELQKAMLLPTAASASAPPPAPAPELSEAAAAAETPAPKPAVDPMLWWSALTQQFGELASQAVLDSRAGMSQLAAAAPKPKPMPKPKSKSKRATGAGASRPKATATPTQRAPRKR
jgi:hypothetical protein